MTSFENVLKKCVEWGVSITEEEFLRIYNLPHEEYCTELARMEQEDSLKRAAFKHLFVAYQSSYPDKEAEWDKKWEEYLSKTGQLDMMEAIVKKLNTKNSN